MRLLSIASGSSGNCIYIGDEDTHLLVDAGISMKRIEAGLADNQLSAKDLNGILITHEHSDHVSGLGVMARRYDIPIFGTRETLHYVEQSRSLGAVPHDLFFEVTPDQDFQIESMRIHPFSISHDAANPVAYRFFGKNRSAAVATDMGNYNDYIINNLEGLDAILIEANHDVHMLQTGKYPYRLKRRILSDHGHLSNETSGRLLNAILHDQMKHIFLGHLSKENNYEALAYEAVRLEIAMGEGKYTGNEFPIEVAKRDTPCTLVEF
jgi:phosphoribosyl 1,2-cyclic phosphodiesterase